MQPLIPCVHKSDIQTSSICPRKNYYQRILNIAPISVDESMLFGVAFHEFVSEYCLLQKDHWKNHGHINDDIFDNSEQWFKWWAKKFTDLKTSYIKRGVEVNTVEDGKAINRALEARQMIQGYIKKPYNRYAEPILVETEFYFEIRRGKRVYPFGGRIDQLLKIQTKYLFNLKMDEASWDHSKGYIYLHRDIKSGKKSSPFMQEFDPNINLYAYALAYANFDLNGDGICDKRIGLIPFANCLYHVKDLIPYVKSGKWGKAGDDRGSGMTFIKRTAEQLKGGVEDDLIEKWQMVNSGLYPRVGILHNHCEKYCSYKTECLGEMKGES